MGNSQHALSQEYAEQLLADLIALGIPLDQYPALSVLHDFLASSHSAPTAHPFIRDLSEAFHQPGQHSTSKKRTRAYDLSESRFARKKQKTDATTLVAGGEPAQAPGGGGPPKVKGKCPEKRGGTAKRRKGPSARLIRPAAAEQPPEELAESTSVLHSHTEQDEMQSSTEEGDAPMPSPRPPAYAELAGSAMQPVQAILGGLSTILLPDWRRRLGQLLDGVRGELLSKTGTKPTDLAGSGSHLKYLVTQYVHYEKLQMVGSFFQMVRLIELAAETDRLLHTSQNRKEKPTLKSISEEIGVKESTLTTWISRGKKLGRLCLTTKPSVLFMLAALDLHKLYWRMSAKELDQLFFLLRQPGDNDHATRNIIIPYILALDREDIPGLNFDFAAKGVLSWQSDQLSGVLAGLKYKVHTLPKYGAIWRDYEGSLKLAYTSNYPQYSLPEVKVVKAQWELPSDPCPVTAKNTKCWTEERRRVLSGCPVPPNMKAFQEAWAAKDSDSPYAVLDTTQCNGGTFKFVDANDTFLGLLITGMSAHLKETWHEDLLANLRLLFPGDCQWDTSNRQDYNFLALHYSYYNRFSEEGPHGCKEAPAPVEDHHHFHIRRQGTGKSNIRQRIPRRSQDIEKDVEEYELLSQIFEEVMNFVEQNMAHYLPKEYDQIRMYCDLLPMDERSPAYPFGGFVLNLRCATKAHRDLGDKLLCVVIPFGNFTGGELCLHEAKLAFKMSPGDILIFPSARLTHFNQHFEGVRGSLVMHSDREGDKWVKYRNGWCVDVERLD